MPPKEEWVALQKKIFTRWVNQKLIGAGHAKIGDVVEGFKTGMPLVHLLEALSEKKSDAKYNHNPKMRVHHLENINHALSFCWKVGVDPKLKPSAENLADGEEKQDLGLVWAIMQTFLKFGDDDQKIAAQDALLMWFRNQIQGYKNTNVADFGKCWHNGMNLCALIHKFRPKLIGDYDALNPANGEANVALAFNAAEKYFGLDKYLTYADFLKLDDKSMFVYCAEYYAGIARQRKIDLAARRINKLIRYTSTNDQLRKELSERAQALHNRINKVKNLLMDRTIDNTMAGAETKLKQFQEYLNVDKSEITKDHLSVQSLYNQLSIRLTDGKRPAYQFPAGVALADLNTAVASLEGAEQDRAAALAQEYNRQVRLARLYAQFQKGVEKINEWTGKSKTYLESPPNVNSTRDAEEGISKHNSYKAEQSNISSLSVQNVNKIGNELIQNKFEHNAKVQGDLQAIAAAFADLDKLSAARGTKLAELLAREIKKDQLRTKLNDLSTAFTLWSRDTAEDIAATGFGFTYLEVKAFADVIAKADGEVNGLLASKKAEVNAVFDDLKGLGVDKDANVAAAVDAGAAKVASALGARKTAFDAELAKQTANDDLCKKLADAVAPVADVIAKEKEKISESKDALEAQLENVNKAIASSSAQNDGLANAEKLQGQVDAAGITYNRHTAISGRDLKVRWTQYLEFLNRKKTALTDEIEAKKLRGITPEQYKEIKAQFSAFDKNKNGKLEKSEVRSALYSLGEEKTKAEVDAILTKFGDGTNLNYQGFENFMLAQLGDADTKDEIVAGFKLIANQQDAAAPADLEMVLKTSDYDYLNANAPKKGANVDYTAWTNAAYSR